jgi:hypothetical protein
MEARGNVLRNTTRFSLRTAAVLIVIAGFCGPVFAQQHVGDRPFGRRFGGLVASHRIVNFGSVGVGTTATQTLHLRNVSSANVKVTNATVSASGFAVSGLTLPQDLAPGEGVSFQVQFTPQAAGTDTGMLTVDSDAVDSALNVHLVGNGAQGILTVNPSSVNFGSVAPGATASQTVVVSNGGSAPINVIQASVSGAGFKMGGLPLPMLMAGSQSASFTVTFAPNSPGNATGTLTFTCDCGPTPVMKVPLSGNGWSQISANPNPVSFGSVPDGTTSSQTIRLTNPGSGTITILKDSVSGTGFGMSGLSLPMALSGGQSATFNAQFAPQSPGSVNGSISLSTDVLNAGPVVISMTGTGTGASLALTANPSSVSFGNVNVGSSSSQSVTFSNSGNSSVTVQSVSASGKEFTVSNTGLPVSLNPGQGVAVNVVFAPNTQGGAQGGLSVTSTASSAPTVSLSGTGMVVTAHSASLTWNASTSTVAGYNVYRGSASGGPYTKQTSSLDGSTAYSDSSVQSATTYFYVVTAVDSSGNESSYSNEATAVIP